MQWTQELPTQPGWYWVRSPYWQDEMAIVHLDPPVPSDSKRYDWFYGPLKAPVFLMPDLATDEFE